MKMLTNYLASPKTRAPFCGYACCGSHGWGRIERSNYAVIHNHNKKVLMRRYAKHADNRLWRREVREELYRQYEDYRDEQDEYYRRNFLDVIDYEDEGSYYDDNDYRGYEDDDYDYEQGYPESYAGMHHLLTSIQGAYINNEISSRKYYAILRILNSRD